MIQVGQRVRKRGENWVGVVLQRFTAEEWETRRQRAVLGVQRHGYTTPMSFALYGVYTSHCFWEDDCVAVDYDDNIELP